MICFKCDKQLETAFPGMEKPHENGEVSDGLIFRASGNYGSRVYDPVMSAPELIIWICDDCITTHKVNVKTRRYAHVATEPVWRDFDPRRPTGDRT